MPERKKIRDTVPGDGPELSLSLDQICYIIAKAREFDVKTGPSSDPTANEMDEEDGAAAALEDRPSDPVLEELTTAIDDLDIEEQIDLVALMWLGRDAENLSEWDGLRATAEQEHTDFTTGYLTGTPMLADHLQAALAMLGRDCEDFLAGHA